MEACHKVLQTAREKALEHSKLIKPKGYQLMADLDKNRHDFLQTLCDVALGKTESSFNRIAWRHDKVLQTTREKALEHLKLIKPKGYQLMADLDKNRHDFLQTLRSFDSKLKPDIVLINESTKDIIIGELTCPMDARMTYWHETKTKKYHDLANRIAEKRIHSPLLRF
jgi:hypothetical protein